MARSPTASSIQQTKQQEQQRDEQARRVTLTGRVQGLGVRPALYRLAVAVGLAGSVKNTRDGVEVEVEGSAKQVDEFLQRMQDELPQGAAVARCRTEVVSPSGRCEFLIEQQTEAASLGARVPVDLAVCRECLDEVADRSSRRYRYPFTSCTRCGPRYTIIRSMPYERADTTMAAFPLCGTCREEYVQPDDRRFHAQTDACPACGPTVWFSTAGGRETARHEDAIRAAVGALRSGRIVALRGIGGYQLLVDATDRSAVERLRQRKRRPQKPLALLVESLPAADDIALLDDEERAALGDPSNPIVLVRGRCDPARRGNADLGWHVAWQAIRGDLHTIGLMLPTTPLHAILACRFGRPLVCTSGNMEGEPLEYKHAPAERSLAALADVWLHHDRPIARPIDDSVVRIIAGRRVTLRLARGLAPLALDLSARAPMLALGGYQKAAAAWSNGSQAALGPHVGDHDHLATRQRFLQQCRDWQALYGFEPELLVHDLHPDYFSTRWAQEQRRPTCAVQHHHAHVVAGMLEQGWLQRKVLGVAWDGTGYGADGTIWGGEFLVATACAYERIAHLRPFRLPGGEAAVREPWRTALSLAVALEGSTHATLAARFLDALQTDHGIDAARIEAVHKIAALPAWSPQTTSAGRLFDAAAAYTLGIVQADFDGQPAMLLEAVADVRADGCYDFPLRPGTMRELDWRPLVAGMLGDRAAGVEPGTMAMKFHRALAAAIVRVCRHRPELPVILSGGVFQNRLLTELMIDMLPDNVQQVRLSAAIPPNDGGLAAGQLAVAAALNER